MYLFTKNAGEENVYTIEHDSSLFCVNYFASLEIISISIHFTFVIKVHVYIQQSMLPVMLAHFPRFNLYVFC